MEVEIGRILVAENQPVAHVVLVKALLAKGRIEEALAAAEQLAATGEVLPARRLLRLVHEEARNDEDGRPGVQQTEESIRGRQQRGRELVQVAQDVVALASTAADPDLASDYRHLVSALVSAECFDDALQAIKQLDALAGKQLVASRLRSRVLAKKGDLEEAIKEGRRAVEAAEQDAARSGVPDATWLASLYLDQGHAQVKKGGDPTAVQACYQMAVDWAERATKLDPQSGPAHRWLADAWGSLGQHRKAAKALERAIDCEGDNGTYWNNFAYHLSLASELDDGTQSSEDKHTALDAADIALRLDPEDAHAHGTRGECLSRMDRFAEAHDSLVRCCQKDAQGRSRVDHEDFFAATFRPFAECVFRAIRRAVRAGDQDTPVRALQALLDPRLAVDEARVPQAQEWILHELIELTKELAANQDHAAVLLKVFESETLKVSGTETRFFDVYEPLVEALRAVAECKSAQELPLRSELRGITATVLDRLQREPAAE